MVPGGFALLQPLMGLVVCFAPMATKFAAAHYAAMAEALFSLRKEPPRSFDCIAPVSNLLEPAATYLLAASKKANPQ